MKPRVMIILALAFLMGGEASPKRPGQEKEETQLQGVWEHIFVEVAGKKLPEEEVRAFDLVISGNQMTLTKSETGKSLSMTFRIDPTKKPKTIDLDFGLPTLERAKGIYELQGDKLRVCMGVDRPREFKTKPNSNEKMFLVKRKK
jgi:uncharacterized protein (TIGR03067 family)